MIGLFFEVWPHEGHEAHYFDTAAALRPDLDQNGGVMRIDRFRSLTMPAKILSHQHWQDTAHLVRWRNNLRHHGAQKAGRLIYFADYRIRICPEHHMELNDASPPTRWVVALSTRGDTDLPDGGETYRSVYDETRCLTLYDADGPTPWQTFRSLSRTGVTRHAFSVLRDYTMNDRAEAPQTW
ncbi:MAG: antibiotic biosynthesis monooxygenase [Pseudomonadota bacterium]